MKYTIYKINNNLKGLRWWRNYDNNHKNAPDVDIETYLTNNSRSWVAMTNTRNEPIKYETISKYSFDTIQLYISDLKNVPDYIKVVYEKDTGDTEAAYYYVKHAPTIYNSKSALASEVTYELDKIASFYYKFHNKCKSSNKNMFFVRKHTNRFLYDTTTSKYYFDVNKQPWYLSNDSQTSDLLVKNKLTLTQSMLQQMITRTWNITWNETVHVDYNNTNNYLTWSTSPYSTWDDTFSLPVYYDDDNDSTDVKADLKINDNLFKDDKGYYEYLITKPKLERFGGIWNEPTAFYIWPISKNASYNTCWGGHNSINALYTNLSINMTESNVIGRFMSSIPPSVIGLGYGGIGSYTSTTSHIVGNNFRVAKKNTGASILFGFIKVDGLPFAIDVPNDDTLMTNTYFTPAKPLVSINASTPDYKKTKENNPHLYAPQNYQLVYAPTSNDKSILTCDYINLLQNYTDTPLTLSVMVANDCYARLGTKDWNSNKVLSQTANELTISDARFAPVQCDAFNNTMLQRQVLDTSRNTQKATGYAALGAEIITLIAGVALAAATAGSASPIALMGVGGSIGAGLGSLKTGLNIVNGEAQYQAQKRALLNQPNSLNVPVSIAGLSGVDSWVSGVQLYTLALSEPEQNIINNDDNMYGYRINTWQTYNTYLNCWHGNYMLCDISRNYNTLFKDLKEINSIFTINDEYINDFLNALNNGITWFVDGIYRDLATDEDNYERVFPQP